MAVAVRKSALEDLEGGPSPIAAEGGGVLRGGVPPIDRVAGSGV